MDTRETAIINMFYDARMQELNKEKQNLMHHICQMIEIAKNEEDKEFRFFLRETLEYLEKLVSLYEQKSEMLNREKEQWLTISPIPS